MAESVVYVFSNVPVLIKNLSEQCPNVCFQEVAVPKSPEFDESVLSQLVKAQILISDPCVSPYVHKLPALKWLQITWGGVDKIAPCFKDLPPPSYQITRFAGTMGPAMAEYVLGNIIANERRFKLCWERQKDHVWLHDIESRTLKQLTLGILGYGDIGQGIARYCKALGMTIWAMGRSPRKELPKLVDQYRTTSGLQEILRSCDYICNVLPSTPETKNMLSGNVLQECQARQSCFINVGRGDVIDEKSLINAINKKWISGALLDVTETEPLPSNSALWDLPGVSITPHCSVGSQCSDQIAEVFAKNLQLYENGKQLDFVMDVERGY